MQACCWLKPKCTTVLGAPHSHGERREYTTIRPFHLTPEHSGEGEKKRKKDTSFKQNTHNIELILNSNVNAGFREMPHGEKKKRLLVEE